MKEKIALVKNHGVGILKHPLFSGSAVMVFGSNFTNFIAYIYHLVIGRLLGPSSYGELAATLSALTLFTSTFVFLGMVIIKFVSASDDKDKPAIYAWFLRKSIVIGLLLTGLLLLISPTISDFIHVDIKIAILIGPITFLFLLSFFFRSFLQGLLKFTQSVVITTSDIGGRFLIGLFLVWIGWSSYGAVLGIFLASIISVVLGLYYLKEFGWKIKKDNIFSKGKDVFKYAIPVLIISFANNSFITTDVILVKHFFAQHDAGIYASVSTLGKVIFFAAAPIGSVMFPLISKRFAKGQGYSKILYLSISMTAVISAMVVLIYYLFPELMVRILFGDEFIEASKYLLLFGIFIAIYTLATLFINYYLSIEKVKVAVFPVVFALLQIIGISFYHSSVLEVVKVSIISTIFLFLSLVIYFGYNLRRQNA